ncbi:hypothetical protein WI560_16605 [Bradyrhizobium sp. A11]|uniref:hypothetical protein n=1 Tax=Bradyrhizobium sp. A11 TaxID=3133974 RepID=UPI0032536D92
MAPTFSKIWSEANPNAAVASSITPSSNNGLTLVRRDIQPPHRLPSPSPSMKAVTMIVTDSELTPKIRNRLRCQVS